MMTEEETIRYQVVCAYGRLCELNAKLIKTVWEVEEHKQLDHWWSNLDLRIRNSAINNMRKNATQAQLLRRRNIVDGKYS